MFKLQLLRYYNSKFTFVILLLMGVITGIRYAELYSFPRQLARELRSNPEDLNVEMATAIVESYRSGIFFFENTVMQFSDFQTMLWYTLGTFFGVFFCGRLTRDIQTNYMSYIASRVTVRAYLRETLSAQVIYMISIVGGFFTMVLLLSVIIRGGGLTPPELSHWAGYSSILYATILLAPLIQLLLFLTTTILVFTLLGVWIRNRYVLQILPFIYVIGMPLIAFTLRTANLWPLGRLVGLMTFDEANDLFINSLNQNAVHMNLPIVYAWLFPLISLVVIIVLYRLNVRKYEKDLLV